MQISSTEGFVSFSHSTLGKVETDLQNQLKRARDDLDKADRKINNLEEQRARHRW